eukprot:TRINITY_DN2571_c0_g1_i1.p1 TRINITY_DN2571_c0_g1~~TRINITY_DN2571_c0_g1_i1.p1  ORF type:complete len:413 (-),score=105.19 TRINITY_DN2571_c0_g1_i1:113-1351(-)
MDPALLKPIFERNDLDQDGHITKDELFSGLIFDGDLRTALGITGDQFGPGTEEHASAAALFDRVDTDRNRAIEFDEFYTFCTQLVGAGATPSAPPRREKRPVKKEWHGWFNNPHADPEELSARGPQNDMEQVADAQSRRAAQNAQLRSYALRRVFHRNDLDLDGQLTIDELMTCLAFDRELRSLLGLKGHAFGPGTEDHTRALALFGEIDGRGVEWLDERQFELFCNQLTSVRELPKAPMPQYTPAPNHGPAYGNPWQVDRLYAELDTAIVEANQLSELRNPAAARSKEWIVQSQAARKAADREFRQEMMKDKRSKAQMERAYLEQLKREDEARAAARREAAERLAAAEEAKRAKAEQAWLALHESDLRAQSEFWSQAHKVKDHVLCVKSSSEAMRRLQKESMHRRPRYFKQ